MLTMADYKAIDGMSNKYWGWGLEDDEFYLRIRLAYFVFEIHFQRSSLLIFCISSVFEISKENNIREARRFDATHRLPGRAHQRTCQCAEFCLSS